MHRRDFVKTTAALSLPILSKTNQQYAVTKAALPPFVDGNDNLIYPTGIDELDEKIKGGLRSCKTYLVVGRQGSGKSAFLRRLRIQMRSPKKFIEASGGKHLAESIIKAIPERSLVLIDDFDQTLYYHNPSLGREFQQRSLLYQLSLTTTWDKHSVFVTSATSKGINYDHYFKYEGITNSAIWTADAVFHIDELDRWGRGTIEIVKNRYGTFLGKITI